MVAPEILKEDKREINSDLASAVVMLANPGLHVTQLSERLKRLERVYEIGHRFKANPNNTYFSSNLTLLLGRLEAGGFGCYEMGFSLTEAGTALLERKVLEAVVNDAETMERLARVAGLNLQSIQKKYIGKYLELTAPK